MNRFYPTAAALLLGMTCAQSFATETIALWPNGAPNKSTITEAEKTDPKGSIFNVTTARIEVDQPKKSNGKAVILIPGGGYGNLSMATIENSFKPFSLKRALPPSHSSIDFLRAIQQCHWLMPIRP